MHVRHWVNGEKPEVRELQWALALSSSGDVEFICNGEVIMWVNSMGSLCRTSNPDVDGLDLDGRGKINVVL